MKQEPKNQFDEFLSNVHKGISLETTPEGKNLEKSTERIDAIESVELPVPKQMSIEPSEKPAKQTYDITLHVAQTLVALNPCMVFNLFGRLYR